MSQQTDTLIERLQEVERTLLTTAGECSQTKAQAWVERAEAVHHAIALLTEAAPSLGRKL